MSSTSLPTPAEVRDEIRSPNMADIQIAWDLYEKDSFAVEIANVGEDLVYHFWPEAEKTTFRDGFGSRLQDAFRWVFRNQPKDADGFPKVDVQAEYTSYEDARVMSGMGVGFPSPALLQRDGPLATFHVKVVGWGGKPLADQFLRDQLLTHLNDLVKADDRQEDLPEPDGPPDVAERNEPRRRRRRRRKQR